MEVDGPCIVCEKCNVGKVIMKLPIGDRVTDLSKTPLTELLSSLLKEVVTGDMMLCGQCLRCLNKKDKLMVLEKRALGEGAKPRGGRGRGRGAPRGGRAGAPTERREPSRSKPPRGRGRGRGGGRKASSSSLGFPEPGSKVPRSGGEVGVAGGTEPGLLDCSAAVPCITAIKDEVMSDEETQQQTMEICFNTDTVVATTTPQCPQDPLALHAGEPFNSDLIKSEITVDGDDCVVGMRCVDETRAPPATVHHVVSSIDGPLPAAECPPPCVNMPPECSSPSGASSSQACSFVYTPIGSVAVTTMHLPSANSPPAAAAANFNVTVTAPSYTNVSAAASASSASNGSINVASISTSLSAPVVLDSSIVLPSASVANENLSQVRPSTFQAGSEDSRVLDFNDKQASPLNNDSEEETVYVDMPDISQYTETTEDVVRTSVSGTVSSHSLITTDSGRLPRGDMVCVGGSVFPCSLCPSSFTTAGALRHHHEQRHNKLKRAQCLSCPFYSPELDDVEEHMRNEHGIKPQHFCRYCEADFIMKDSYQNHIKVVHKMKSNRFYDKMTPSTIYRKKTITCPHCEHPFVFEKDLMRHNNVKHDGAKFPCHYCSFKCGSYKTWTRHDAEKHKKKSKIVHTCTECMTEFDSEIGLEAHCASEHKLEKTHRCKLCGDLFITAAMMRFHVNKHNPYTCPICNVGFKKLENYQAHLSNIHNNDRPGLTLQEVPGQVSAVLSSHASDTVEGSDPTAELVTSPTKVLQLSSNVMQTQRAESTLEQASVGDGEIRQYNEEVAEEYLKQVRGTPNSQKVPCIFCSKEVTAGHLRTHFKNHSGVTPYACDFCSKVCIQSTNLRKHVRSKHPEHFQNWDSNAKTPKKKSIACEFCGRVYEGVDECEAHLWEHMATKEHECSLCKTRFGSENNLKEHMKTHYFETLQTCEHCKRTFKNIGAYNEHVENCKNQWTCTICGLCLQSENKFRKHVKSTHSGSDVFKFVCPEPGCGRKFFQKHRYDDHCITHESERRYQCPNCHKKFKRLRPMNDHIKCKHNGLRCSSCEVTFASLDQLVQHRMKSHSSDFHECPECALVFVNNATLANHTRSYHPDDEVFEVPECHVCNERFSNEAELSTHFTEHQKGSYICCSFACYSSAPCEDDFRDHLSAEHADLDYECAYCQADQLSEAALRRHYVDSHGKERRCKMCAAPFYKDEHLQRHASQHSDDSKYLCDACDFTCSNRYWMVSHLRNSHYVSSENLMGCVMKQRVYGCPSCDTLTVTLPEMTQHILTHEISNDSEVLAFILPTKLESDLICCPVCSTPWPNQSTIIQHLQMSKFCAEQLSAGDRTSQTRTGDAAYTDLLALGNSAELQVENDTNTAASNDLNIVFVDEGEGVYSSILTSDGKSGGATLVEVNGQQYLAPLSDAVLDGGCSKAATVVEVDGEHYVVLRESEDDCTEVEASDLQQPSADSNQLSTDTADESLNVLLQPPPVPEQGASVMLDEEHLSSLFNGSKEIIYAHDM